MRSLLFRCIVLVGVLLPSSARAQRAADLLTVGVKVRVTAPALDRVTGTVVSYGSDVLALAPEAGAAPLQVPTSAVTQLEVSRGRNRLTWGLGGALAGGLAVGIIGGVQGGHDDPTGLGARTGVAAGFILGALLGGIGGAVFAPEHWQDVTALVKSAS